MTALQPRALALRGGSQSVPTCLTRAAAPFIRPSFVSGGESSSAPSRGQSARVPTRSSANHGRYQRRLTVRTPVDNQTIQ